MYRPNLYSALLACLIGLLLAAPASALDPPPAQSSQDQRPRVERDGAQNRWRQMSPQQRQQVREGVRTFRRMDPQQRQRTREAFHKYKSLPSEQRRALRKQWREQREPRHQPRPRRQQVPRDDNDDDPRRGR